MPEGQQGTVRSEETGTHGWSVANTSFENLVAVTERQPHTKRTCHGDEVLEQRLSKRAAGQRKLRDSLIVLGAWANDP
jgi:hypothetical protein